MCFAVCLLLFVLFVLPSPLLELCPAVILHLCVSLCHICTVPAVVPGVSPPSLVRLRGVFWCSCVFLLLLVLLWRCGSVLLRGFCVAVGVFWFRGLLGVAPGVWCVLLFFCWFCFVLLWSAVLWCVGCFMCVAGVCWLLFCLCWFWCVLVGPLFFWLVVVAVLLCPLFCSWWCCSSWLSLLCVAPSWCWLLLVGSCVWLLFFWW